MRSKKCSQLTNRGNIIIKDSCIIIDLIELNLIGHFLSLDYYVITTVNVVDEISIDQQKVILESYLESNQIVLDDMMNLGKTLAIMNEYNGLSFTDASVLELAIRINGTMLTSDNTLRKAGMASGKETHGSLWAIRVIFEKGLISRHEATNKIHELMRINKRITLNLCKDLLSTLDSEKATYNPNK